MTDRALPVSPKPLSRSHLTCHGKCHFRCSEMGTKALVLARVPSYFLGIPADLVRKTTPSNIPRQSTYGPRP
jgi:hypothetical protein